MINKFLLIINNNYQQHFFTLCKFNSVLLSYFYSLFKVLMELPLISVLTFYPNLTP